MHWSVYQAADLINCVFSWFYEMRPMPSDVGRLLGGISGVDVSYIERTKR